MKKIIIFTNSDSLNSVNPTFAQRADINLLTLANPILRFDETGSIFISTQSFIESGLYFVFDAMEENNFNTLINNIDKSDCYVLKHKRNPKFTLQGFAELLPDGIHEADNKGKYYPDVVNVILEKGDEKVNKIFDAIFKTDPEIDLWLKPFEDIAPNKIDPTLEAAAKKIKIDVKAKYNLPP